MTRKGIKGMKNWSIDIPVIFIIFNRYDTAIKVFEQIKRVRPRQLFIISDGARIERNGEAEKVKKVREIIKDIDWNCEVHKNFSDINLGCDKRIVSGINWAFQYVDRAVILEDDCFPTEQFLDFCKAMLEKYQKDKRIAYIAGSLSIKNFRCPYDYFYSYFGDTWGWATWRDRWELYEFGTENFRNQMSDCMRGIFSERERQSLIKNMERNFEQENYPWDYIWLVNTAHMLKIVPRVNLVSNIGFSGDGTHTVMKPKGYYGKIGKLSKKYTHPEMVEHNKEYAKAYEKAKTYHIWDRVYGKIKTVIYRIGKK